MNKKACHTFSCPLSEALGRFRWLVLYMIFNGVGIMINGRI